MTTPNIVGFFAAATLLAVVPGPGMLYVLTRAIAGGRRAGLESAAGTALGGSVHAFAAAVGLSAILAASVQAYTVVRWIGAAYLIYLGVRTWIERADTSRIEPPRRRKAFVQGILTEILNPKTAIFFLAFIPTFVPAGPAASSAGWFLLLGLLSVALNTTADVIAVMFATTLGRNATASPTFARWRRRGSGFTLIGMGVLAAAHDTRK